MATAAHGCMLYPSVARKHRWNWIRTDDQKHGSKHGLSPTTTEGGKTRLTRTHWPLGSPSEPHETARALRARLRPPHGPHDPPGAALASRQAAMALQRPTGRRRISRSTRSHWTIHGFADT